MKYLVKTHGEKRRVLKYNHKYNAIDRFLFFCENQHTIFDYIAAVSDIAKKLVQI